MLYDVITIGPWFFAAKGTHDSLRFVYIQRMHMHIKHLLLTALLMIFAWSCIKSPNDNQSIFYVYYEYWPGNDFYPFPDGIYAKYKPGPGESLDEFNPDIILHSLHNAGIQIVEAWDIRSIKPFQWSPNFVLRLKNEDQPVDTLHFSFNDKPRLGFEANITHYIFR